MALKKCPMCQGRTPNNVFARVISGPCDYCGGLGQLETNRMASCGRPATKQIGDIWVCAKVRCACTPKVENREKHV